MASPLQAPVVRRPELTAFGLPLGTAIIQFVPLAKRISDTYETTKYLLPGAWALSLLTTGLTSSTVKKGRAT